MVSSEIIYITLSANKRSFIYKDYLNTINLPANPFFGYDYTKSSDVIDYKYFSKNLFKKRYGRNPKNGEIGCVLSHFHAIKSSKSDMSLVILEDDALIMDSTKKFLRLIELIGDDQKYEIVIFGFSKCDQVSYKQLNIGNPFVKTINFNNFNYSLGERLIHSTSGALAYYVSPSAKKKISSLKKIFHVADDWKFYSDLGIKIGYVYPSIVIEDCNQRSNLDHNENYFRQLTHKNKFINSLLIIRRYLIGFFRKFLLKNKIYLLNAKNLFQNIK